MLAILLALLMPAHLRATDPHVIRKLGVESSSLVQFAAETASHNPPVAKILLATAESLELEGTDHVLEELRNYSRTETKGRTILEQLEAQESGRIQVGETAIFNALRKAANRERLLASLHSLEAKQILRNRALTNLIIFAPVKSAAGQPLDIAILTTAFLFEHRAFSSTLPLREQVLRIGGLIERMPVSDHVVRYAVALSRGTRPQDAATYRVPNGHGNAEGDAEYLEQPAVRHAETRLQQDT